MSHDAYNLGRIERWMQTVIMHPAGVQQGIASEDARRHLDITTDEIEKVITRSNALTAAERLAYIAGPITEGCWNASARSSRSYCTL